MSDADTSEHVVLVLYGFMYILLIHICTCFCIFTAFVPLNELINSLSPEMLCKWERLWMLSDRREGVVHPLVYPHPVTGLKVCIHIVIVNLYNHVYSSHGLKEVQVRYCHRFASLMVWSVSSTSISIEHFNVFLTYQLEPNTLEHFIRFSFHW